MYPILILFQYLKFRANFLNAIIKTLMGCSDQIDAVHDEVYIYGKNGF
jgi:hypothetical protein